MTKHSKVNSQRAVRVELASSTKEVVKILSGLNLYYANLEKVTLSTAKNEAKQVDSGDTIA